VVTLHGADGDAAAGLAPWQPLTDAHQLALLAPESRGSTWDAMGGRFGHDVEYLNGALIRVFALVPLDQRRAQDGTDQVALNGLPPGVGKRRLIVGATLLGGVATQFPAAR
jgi:hypothetical protein